MTLTIALIALLTLAATAKAHRPGLHPPGSLETPLIHWDRSARARTNQAAKAKCVTVRRDYHYAYQIPQGLRLWAIRVELGRRLRILEDGSRCRPTSPEGIIRWVFPRLTEDAAVSVARCESHLYPWAKNPRSSASGLFQLLAFHWAGRFDPFNPWANTRYAYRLSDAGTNWSAWVCSP